MQCVIATAALRIVQRNLVKAYAAGFEPRGAVVNLKVEDVQRAVQSAIAEVLRPLTISGNLKTGISQLQPQIAARLRAEGLIADEEDSRQLLKSKMAVWRSKDDNEIVPTRARRKIDIVVYDNDELVALIETESSLNDLRVEGVSSRNGHYDVFSIAKDEAGQWFHSYNSLERMAAAAYFHHHALTTGTYPAPDEGVRLLVSLQSDAIDTHNPAGIAMYLVSGKVRDQDPSIVEKRLSSVGAVLMCATGPEPFCVV